MFENIRLSFQGIWSHKMRSFLTMLGIIIGIAAIIAIVSTIKGTNEQIKENLIGSGENTVEVSLYQGEWEYEMDYNGVPQGVPLVTDEVMSDIKDLDHVENASAYLSRQDYSGVYHLNTAFSGGYVRGIDNSYFDTCNYVMKEGRAFTDEDFKKLLSCGYRMENYLKPDLTQEKTFQSLYFMNMHLTEVKLQEAAQKLFSDKSCGNVFRVKGFMKNEKEQWIELNATQKNLVISPIKMGQEVIIVIGEQLVEDAIRSCLEV